MKRLVRIAAVCAMLLLSAGKPVYAIDTVPSSDPLIDGSFIISGYSISGHTLRYAQITNNSNEIASLDGWKLSLEWSTGVWVSEELNGLLPAHKKIIFADNSAVPGATYNYNPTEQPTDPRATTLKLVAPLGRGFNDHTVSISVSSSTVSIASVPATYYFARNISSSTGNFLSTFTAFVPNEDFVLEQDELYHPLSMSPLTVTEIYPEAVTCEPGSASLLCGDYVKLQNISSSTVDLSSIRIRVGSAGQAASSSNTSYPTGSLASGSYVVVPLSLTNSGSWVWVEDVYGVSLYSETISAYPSSSGHTGWSYAFNDVSGQWQWTKYPTPFDQDNQFASGGKINECSGLRLSEIGANYSPQFIELFNSTSRELDISGCQIQTNRSQTNNYIFSEGTSISSNEYVAVSIDTAKLSLTKTTSGTVYILSSDGSVEVDARSYEDLDENTSYALVGGKWLQTFMVTPGNENSYSEYPACEAGYIRNLETGRCNKIPVEASLTPCLPTQYRSPETNRCRNIASASTLTPCKPGQYRSPETNRCRSLSSASSTLKPCLPNQERNPETNRCRNIVKVTNADFPVETIADSGEAAIGWWAFGGVGMIAASYAGWEWRREAMGFIRKAASFIPLGR